MMQAPTDTRRSGATHTIVHQLLERAHSTPTRIAFAVWPRHASAVTAHVTWASWAAQAEALGASLVSAGVRPGDRVAIFADNRPLWPFADMATMLVRGVAVGLYPTSATAQVRTMLADSRPRVVFVDTRARAEQVLAVRDALPAPCVVVCEDGPQAGHGDASMVPFIDWLAAGHASLAKDAAIRSELAQRAADVTLDDDAVIIYTSGSTGEPKGARLSHRYLVASAESIRAVLGLESDDDGVSFLPYCHAAERVFGQAVRVHVGMAAVLVEDPADVFAAMAAVEPTVLGGLPRIYEKIDEAVRAGEVAGQPPATVLRGLVGRRLRCATSGGAPLAPAVVAHLNAHGVSVLGAYGQTEHLCIAMHRPGTVYRGGVGPLMPGTAARVDESGELLVQRTALTFSGYFEQPDETAAVFTPDGSWLRTGDLAVIDSAGVVHITGRVKELLALSTGKKVAPLPIEAALAASPLITHAVCVGEGRKFLAALLVLNRTAVSALARSAGLSSVWPEVVEEPVVLQAIASVIETVNAERSRPEQVRRWRVLTDDWSVAGGELTPTFKVRRAAVCARYDHVIEALYAV